MKDFILSKYVSSEPLDTSHKTFGPGTQCPIEGKERKFGPVCNIKAHGQ